MFPQNGATHGAYVYIIGFAKAALDGKAPILGFILLHKHRCNDEITKWVYFANNDVVFVLLLPHNRIFAAYITIGSLSLGHDKTSEKIIQFAIFSNYVMWRIQKAITK